MGLIWILILTLVNWGELIHKGQRQNSFTIDDNSDDEYDVNDGDNYDDSEDDDPFDNAFDFRGSCDLKDDVKAAFKVFDHNNDGSISR